MFAMHLLSRIVLLATLALVALLPRSEPAVAFEMKICDHCGRLWDDSPSRVRALADGNGKPKDINTCSPYCLAAVLKSKPHYKLESAQVVLWDEREEVRPLMLNAANSRFLIGVKDAKDLSHDPDIAAFRSDQQLATSKGKLGGKTVSWDEIMKRCRKLAAEADDDDESDYQPLKMRKY
jgi:hypothetical protein